jgi:hypothetical protein
MTRGSTGSTKFTSPRVGGRGRGPRGGVSRALRPRLAAGLVAALTLSACVAKQSAGAVETSAPGFLLGIWHGFIFPVAWVFSLFVDDISVYAVPNNGGWYDFGYFLGIVVFGVGASGARKRR